jgi:hypothetical protein
VVTKIKSSGKAVVLRDTPSREIQVEITKQFTQKEARRRFE